MFSRSVVPFALCLLPWLGGCAGTSATKQTKAVDPLVGAVDPKTTGPGPIPAVATKAKAAEPPSLPEATWAASNAKIATSDPLAGGRPLGIRDEQQPAADGWALRRPEPIVPGAPFTPAPVRNVVPVTWGGAAASDEYEQLQAQLRARKVTWQRQETYDDGFKFTCSVPNPRNPDFSRVYEATALDYRAAIRAVLEQIDRNR